MCLGSGITRISFSRGGCCGGIRAAATITTTTTPAVWAAAANQSRRPPPQVRGIHPIRVVQGNHPTQQEEEQEEGEEEVWQSQILLCRTEEEVMVTPATIHPPQLLERGFLGSRSSASRSAGCV